jgi:hypothetical protein
MTVAISINQSNQAPEATEKERFMNLFSQQNLEIKQRGIKADGPLLP